MGRHRNRDRNSENQAVKDALKLSQTRRMDRDWKFYPCPLPFTPSSGIQPLKDTYFILDADRATEGVDLDYHDKIESAVEERGATVHYPNETIPTTVTTGLGSLPRHDERQAGVRKFFTEKALADYIVKVDNAVLRRLESIPVANGIDISSVLQSKELLENSAPSKGGSKVTTESKLAECSVTQKDAGTSALPSVPNLTHTPRVDRRWARTYMPPASESPRQSSRVEE